MDREFPQLPDQPGPSHAVRGLETTEGRSLYGRNPAAYALGRPDYPPGLYRRLDKICRLGRGARVLEIGPGSGRVTRRLAETGASVTTVEANREMAAFLEETFAGSPVRVIAESFEEASLPNAGFDLAVAATSFHWVAQPQGWIKLRRVVKPGGRVALWWMLFEDPTAPPDEFDLAVQAVLGGSPSAVLEPGQLPFQVDVRGRCGELSSAGLIDVRGELIRSHAVLDAEQVQRLYATFAIVLRRPPAQQAQILSDLKGLVVRRFGGKVERHFVTAIYVGRNP